MDCTPPPDRDYAAFMIAALLLCLPLPVPQTVPAPPLPNPDCQEGQIVVGGQTMPYLLLPPAEMEEGKTYPLVVFLHGAGERGSDNRAQWAHFPAKMASAEYQKKYPCFLLAPQCPKDQSWVDVNWSDEKSTPFAATPTPSMQAAMAAVKEVVAKNAIDRDRILLTGLSMGGYGTWDLAMRQPDWFAGAVTICGGGDEKSIPRLAGLPMQVWHGGSDGVVSPQRSRVMVKAAKKWKMPVEYFELKGIGHNSWVDAYGKDGCLDWLFAQKRDPKKRQLAAAQMLAAAIKPNERIAFLGDSITQSGAAPNGYVDQIRQILEKHMPTSAVIPAGISGHKVPDLLKRLKRDVLDHKATLVFIYIGINDVWHSQSGNGTPADEYEAGLHKLIQQLKDSGATVVLAAPSVIGERQPGKNGLDQMLTEFVGISKRVAAKEGLVFCNLNRAFADHLDVFGAAGEKRKAKGVLTSDGVHLNAAGNAFVATEAAIALLRAIRQR
jgi:lysophospholipase L1-like esterase/poly(3-hydroxybutyrate) depolymerase